METLKENIYKVVEKEIKINEFENWLYTESNLVDRMDEDIVFELFNFNYKQRGVDYEFEKLFLSFFDEKNFINWKIVANLKTLSEGCKQPERILSDFYELGYNGYSFLSCIGYNQYELEDCEFYGWSREELINEIQKEANQLVVEIKGCFESNWNFDLSQFQPKIRKIDMIHYHALKDVVVIEAFSVKWWRFWK